MKMTPASLGVGDMHIKTTVSHQPVSPGVVKTTTEDPEKGMGLLNVFMLLAERKCCAVSSGTVCHFLLLSDTLFLFHRKLLIYVYHITQQTCAKVFTQWERNMSSTKTHTGRSIAAFQNCPKWATTGVLPLGGVGNKECKF